MTSAVPSECPKCRSRMQPGYLLDRGPHGRLVSAWVEGEPSRSFWTGLTLPPRRHETRTWRCTRCGYLESYAPAS